MKSAELAPTEIESAVLLGGRWSSWFPQEFQRRPDRKLCSENWLSRGAADRHLNSNDVLTRFFKSRVYLRISQSIRFRSFCEELDYKQSYNRKNLCYLNQYLN